MIRVLLTVVLFLLVGCASKIRVNNPSNYCGYAFILIDKRFQNTSVELDRDGIGTINEDFFKSGTEFQYVVTYKGKDITDQCEDFGVHTLGFSDSPKEFQYLSFRVNCGSKSFKNERKRFDEVRSLPKVITWLGRE